MIQQTTIAPIFPHIPEEIVETIFSYIDSQKEVEKFQLVHRIWYNAGQNFGEIACKRKFFQEFRYLNLKKPQDIKWKEYFTNTEREELPKALDYAIEKFDFFDILHTSCLKRRVFYLINKPMSFGQTFFLQVFKLALVFATYILILDYSQECIQHKQYKLCFIPDEEKSRVHKILPIAFLLVYLPRVVYSIITYPLATRKIIDYADRHYQITDSINQFPKKVTDSIKQFPKKAACSIL